MEKPNPCIAQGSEEDEDTLSLSDLSMYYDQNVEYHVEDPSMSDEQDFEFSSEMMISSTDSLNHVIFCGKILYVSPEKIQILESMNQRRGIHSGVRIEGKVSIMASKRKSRWYLFMFGFGSSKFPKEMQIKDLRRRKTSRLSKCNNYTNCDGYVGRRGMGKSQGLIRFLQCGGGINDSNNEIGDSPSRNIWQKSWMSS